MLKTFHGAKCLQAFSLLLRMLPHVLKMTAREPQKLTSSPSDVVGINATCNVEPPVMLHCLGKHNLPGNMELTDSTPSLAHKVFPSINDCW